MMWPPSAISRGRYVYQKNQTFMHEPPIIDALMEKHRIAGQRALCEGGGNDLSQPSLLAWNRWSGRAAPR